MLDVTHSSTKWFYLFLDRIVNVQYLIKCEYWSKILNYYYIYLQNQLWTTYYWFLVKIFILHLQVHTDEVSCQCHFLSKVCPFFYILNSALFISVWALYNPWAKAHFSLGFIHCTSFYPLANQITLHPLIGGLHTNAVAHYCHYTLMYPESANRNHTGNILDDGFHSVQNVTRMTQKVNFSLWIVVPQGYNYGQGYWWTICERCLVIR